MNIANVYGDPGVDVERRGVNGVTLGIRDEGEQGDSDFSPLPENLSSGIQPLEILSSSKSVAGQATSIFRKSEFLGTRRLTVVLGSMTLDNLFQGNRLRDTSALDLRTGKGQEGANGSSPYALPLPSPIASLNITSSNIAWQSRTVQEEDVEIASARQRKRKREVDGVDTAAPKMKARAAVVCRAPRLLRRGVISGFPPMNSPLPPGLEDDEIITAYPNHLRGAVLLRLNEKGWGAKEIVELAQCPQLKPNTLVKRIQIANTERDGIRPSWRSRQLQRPADSTEQTSESPQSWVIQGQVELESEASRNFRIEQTGIRDIAVEMKPDMFTRSFRRTKRTAADDRMIAEQAAAEYEKRVAQQPDTQGGTSLM
ncbi:MAG: hypothetical protein M1830_010712 [Pleopsidium flavum]|nr:MAG: hypothetical protein M1830_010712 [Pleopsidium flavum]